MFEPQFNIYEQQGLRGHFLATDLESQKLASQQERKKQATSFQRPELDYLPSLSVFEARSAQIAADPRKFAKRNGSELPSSFPKSIIGPRVWSHDNIANSQQLVQVFSAVEVTEIEAALLHFLGKLTEGQGYARKEAEANSVTALPGDNGPDDVSQETFPLPTLASKLRNIAQQVHDGKGLAILRGLDPSKYTHMENAIVFLGVSSYIAEQRGVQDKFGNMIAHIANYAPGIEHSHKADDAASCSELPFHNDSCHILGFYTKTVAAEGGDFTSASSANVYNELAASRPDVIQLLSESRWIYDQDVLPENPKSRPLLHLSLTHGPFFLVSRKKLTGSWEYPLSADLPVMTEEEAEALDLLHFTAKKHSTSFENVKGDMTFCNNLAMFHARKAFSEKDDSRRTILRLWLRNDQLAWGTPTTLEEIWFDTYGMSPRREVAFWKIEPQDFQVEQFLTHKMTCWN